MCRERLAFAATIFYPEIATKVAAAAAGEEKILWMDPIRERG